LYFTFAGRPPDDGNDEVGAAAWREAYYERAWEVATVAVMEKGAAISHHHGIGLNRSRSWPRPSAVPSVSSRR